MRKNLTCSEEIEEKRYRHFIMLLYPEWPNFNDILQDIKGSFKNYAYIKHVPEEKEKKEHIHFILSLDNPRTISSLSKRLSIPNNLIKNCKSLRASCRYLIHKDNEEKYQYDIDQVICSNSFKPVFGKSFDDLMNDEDILDSIYCFIKDNLDKYNAIEMEINLTRFVCSNGFERVFRRYYNTICKYINFYCKSS